MKRLLIVTYDDTYVAVHQRVQASSQTVLTEDKM